MKKRKDIVMGAIVISLILSLIAVIKDPTFVSVWQKVGAFIVIFCIDLVIIGILYKIFQPLFKKMAETKE